MRVENHPEIGRKYEAIIGGQFVFRIKVFAKDSQEAIEHARSLFNDFTKNAKILGFSFIPTKIEVVEKS